MGATRMKKKNFYQGNIDVGKWKNHEGINPHDYENQDFEIENGFLLSCTSSRSS